MTNYRKNTNKYRGKSGRIPLTDKQRLQRDDLGRSITVNLPTYCDLFYVEDGVLHQITSGFMIKPLSFDVDYFIRHVQSRIPHGQTTDGYYYINHKYQVGNYIGETWKQVSQALELRGFPIIHHPDKVVA